MPMEIKTENSKVVLTNEIYTELESVLNTVHSSSKKMILTDETVFGHWIEALITNTPALHEAEIIQLPAGEDSKCIEIAAQVWESLSEYKFNRNDVIINFGGGVITDLGGFVASTYKRGISFINIPTTLLSQVDASVGGKTGIDLGPYKNQIGSFAEAGHVLIDPIYLTTLTDEQLLSGYAEMLKHGLIQSAIHWETLKTTAPSDITNRPQLIFDSINIKHQIVASDPFEENDRKALNFGHTIGHGIEGYYLKPSTTYTTWLCSGMGYGG